MFLMTTAIGMKNFGKQRKINTLNKSLVKSKVKKTGFKVITYMKADLYDNNVKLEKPFVAKSNSKKILLESKHKLNKGHTLN